MPIISSIEARSRKGRLLLTVITLVLTLGAATMIYPFLVMVGGALTSEMDAADMRIIPRYLYQDDALYRKFLETKYGQNVGDLNMAHGRGDYSFRNAALPERVDERTVELVRRFIVESDLPPHWQNLGGIVGIKTSPRPLRDLRDRLRANYNDDMSEAGQSLGIIMSSWLDVTLQKPQWTNSQYNFTPNPLHDLYLQMLRESAPADRELVSLTGHFLHASIYPRYGEISVEAYNAAHREPLRSYRDFELPRRVPGEDQPTLRAEWIAFVMEDLNPSFVVLPELDAGEYRAFLESRYETIAQLNESWATEHATFAAVELPDGRRWLGGAERVDYQQFTQSRPPEALLLVGPEYAWSDWLAGREASALTGDADLADQRIPIEQLEYAHAMANATSLRWEYATRNFVIVMRQLLFQGRALINTVILCVLMIAMALLVNPLAAYAMSRYRQPWTFKALLILMATISFPPMVTTIPMFIMMRQFDLLNTFWALFIPTAANGYMVFLLKGFFDSLPREVYEAAEIDGFSEVRMFFQLTLSLSKPILAVVALEAFTAAYTMFLYALIVCPDPDMWLLSVWLFQFQQNANSSAVFASILIASIPTLIMFLLCQNIIMRGIMIPHDK